MCKADTIAGYPRVQIFVKAFVALSTVRHLYQPGFQDQGSLSSLVRVHFT